VNVSLGFEATALWKRSSRAAQRCSSVTNRPRNTRERRDVHATLFTQLIITDPEAKRDVVRYACVTRAHFARALPDW